jgi:NAD-dependent dihydropyrimidine dehydrogenase PreA subunit
MRYILAGKSLVLDTGRCVGCGVCAEVCPHAVFALAEGKAAIAARGRCMECGACARNCPALALKVETGVGCAAAIIGGLVRGTAPDCGCGAGDASCGGPACC